VRKAFFLAVAAASVAVIAACVGDDPVPATAAPDASTDSPTSEAAIDSGTDAGVDAAVPCKIDAPFTTVERVATFSTDNGDYGLSFTADGLGAYVASGAGTQVVYVHTRLSTAVPFGAAIPLSGMPSDAYNYAPTISADGKELFFTHRFIASGTTDVYRAEISGGGAVNIAPAPGVNDEDAGVADESPYLANERVLYFSRSTPSGGLRIFRAERASTASSFTSVVPVSGLGTFPLEANAVVTADELDVYFTASEEDAGAVIATRVMRASRGNVQMPFGAPVPVDKLDVPTGRDAPLWLSPDRCMLYFLSDREKLNTNNPDIWVAKRNP
jgi:hypothetical protein